MKRFETNVFIMDVYEDAFVSFIVKKDALLDAKDLWESRKLSLEYMPGAKFFVLMESEDIFNITKETRDTAASKEFAKDLCAVALCTNNFSLKLLGSLYIKINKPFSPTKLFNNREKAEAWLRGLM
jgi:hypothetical protein